MRHFRPPEAPAWLDEIIAEEATRYNLPRWFYYAIIQRESTFDPSALNGANNGAGLTQLTGAYYNGALFPEDMTEPDRLNSGYRDDMNFKTFGIWLNMAQVSPLTDPFDAGQNLDRFSTGFAVPAFQLIKAHYGLDDQEALRAVAYHWHHGVYQVYDPAEQDYLALYDSYVARYQPAVEATDGPWDDQPRIPSPNGIPLGAAQLPS